ncbi:LysR family transcriptional regulator [Nocardioides sp. R1-1]|uniref:LysR family transcriptional regulator n=1 Tax=Nocardioides sp. R1-1 TaxID=3383502 RepID=UPI0038CF92C6
MDLVEALRSFRAVAHERSFTRGAERCGQPQPVASRRIAALERRLGVRLLVRTSRRVDLSPEGERLLPLADEVLAGLERIDHLFDDAGPRLVIGVPCGVDPRARAAVRRGLPLVRVDFVEGEPEERADGLRTGTCHLALVAAAPDAGDLVVPLGLAHGDGAPGELSLEDLRRPVRQRDLPARAIHIRAEDDVPAVRDPLRAGAFGAGLRADQVRIATPDAEAWTGLHQWDDVVLASAAEARREGVAWSALPRPGLVRSYRLTGEHVLDAAERHALVRRLADGLGGTSTRRDVA